MALTSCGQLQQKTGMRLNTSAAAPNAVYSSDRLATIAFRIISSVAPCSKSIE